MSTVVLDTNVVSFLMRGGNLADLYVPRIQGHTLAISFMTVAEMYEGALRSNWGDRRVAMLRTVLRSYLVIPSSPQVCWHWGQIRTERRHQPISVDDAWIAATARAHGCALVTHNPGDFAGVADLEVVTEHPAEQ